MKSYFFSILILITFSKKSFSALPANDFIFPNINCNNLTQKNCFRAVQDTVLAKYSGHLYPDDQDLIKDNNLELTKFNHSFRNISQVPIIITQGHKTEFVFVFFHGLWGSGSQLSSLYKVVSKSLNSNFISVVLPGHGADTWNGHKTTYLDWLMSAQNALDAAKQLGDKVILVGQSTGGLISTYYALKRPTDVYGIALIEPALKVKSIWDWISCKGGSVWKEGVETNSITLTLEALLGTNQLSINKPFALNMGCEVQKLAKHMRGEFIKKNANSKFSADELKQLYNKIEQPVFIQNLIGDHIVDSDHNIFFKESVQGPVFYSPMAVNPQPNIRALRKRSIKKRMKRRHGQGQSILTMIQSKAFSDFLSQGIKMDIESLTQMSQVELKRIVMQITVTAEGAAKQITTIGKSPEEIKSLIYELGIFTYMIKKINYDGTKLPIKIHEILLKWEQLTHRISYAMINRWVMFDKTFSFKVEYPLAEYEIENLKGLSSEDYHEVQSDKFQDNMKTLIKSLNSEDGKLFIEFISHKDTIINRTNSPELYFNTFGK